MSRVRRPTRDADRPPFSSPRSFLKRPHFRGSPVGRGRPCMHAKHPSAARRPSKTDCRPHPSGGPRAGRNGDTSRDSRDRTNSSLKATLMQVVRGGRGPRRAARTALWVVIYGGGAVAREASPGVAGRRACRRRQGSCITRPPAPPGLQPGLRRAAWPRQHRASTATAACGVARRRMGMPVTAPSRAPRRHVPPRQRGGYAAAATRPEHPSPSPPAARYFSRGNFRGDIPAAANVRKERRKKPDERARQTPRS